MAFQLSISNRQRRVKLDLKRFSVCAQELFNAALENLKNKPPGFLNRTQLESLSRLAVLSVAIVSNKQIQKLNKEWRQKDYATDVLSFTLELDPQEDAVPFEMGELIISAEKAQEQAKEYGHSFEREMAFLFVHGLLHVLGFDHQTPQEEKDMFGRQKEILNKSGYMR